MLDKETAFTVKLIAGLVTPPKLAVILLEPAPAPVACPFVSVALLIVAALVLEEVQVTLEVRLAVVPSV